MLAPVFNAMTKQWMLGRIDSHVAASLAKEEIEAHLKQHDELLRDKARLDWLMPKIPGAERRYIGVHYPANCFRENIDAAMSAEGGSK